MTKRGVKREIVRTISRFTPRFFLLNRLAGRVDGQGNRLAALFG